MYAWKWEWSLNKSESVFSNFVYKKSRIGLSDKWNFNWLSFLFEKKITLLEVEIKNENYISKLFLRVWMNVNIFRVSSLKLRKT